MSPAPDMRVIAIDRPGGPEVLLAARRPIPVPGADEILIRVAAAGVNRPDAMQRRGLYDPPKGASDLPGLEAAGEVVATGAAVWRWKPGDKVCALLPGGGYADYALTHQDHALIIPEGLSQVEAAALPEAAFVCWTNLFGRGRLRAGETLLVHGGTSGIGTMAIQLACAMGARVFATAGSEPKCAVCRSLGADIAINYRDADFGQVVRQATGGRGVDVILDMVGGSYINRNIDALAPDGRLVMVAFIEGPVAEVNFSKVMMRRLTLTGSTMRPQSVQAKAGIAEALRRQAWPLVAAGRVRPVIDSTFPLEDAALAHARIESPDHIGKIVLTT
jgi:NADPH:quinone reductase